MIFERKRSVDVVMSHFLTYKSKKLARRHNCIFIHVFVYLFIFKKILYKYAVVRVYVF